MLVSERAAERTSMVAERGSRQLNLAFCRQRVKAR
jgi:hypothetical protein